MSKRSGVYHWFLLGAITVVIICLALLFPVICPGKQVTDLVVTTDIFLEAPGRLPRILSCNSGTAIGQRALDIHLDDGYNYTVCFELFIDGDWRTVFSESEIRFGEWTELRCEYANRRMSIYINGRLDAQRCLEDLQDYSIAECDAPIVFGKAGWANAYPFTGRIENTNLEGDWPKNRHAGTS